MRLAGMPKIRFDELVNLMVQADLKEAQKDHLARTSGFPVYDYNE